MLWSSRPINAKAFDYFSVLKKVRDYFEINYFEPISLRKAASIAGLEEKHFSKMFRTHVGVGFRNGRTSYAFGKRSMQCSTRISP